MASRSRRNGAAHFRNSVALFRNGVAPPPPENPRQYWLLEHWTALYLISTLLLLIMPVEN